MKTYSQKDPRYKNVRVGFGKLTIGQAGCFLCCLSSIAEIEPPEANRLLKLHNGYGGKYGNLIRSENAAKALGLEYQGKQSPLTTSIQYPVIMETNYYKSRGIPQHFVIMTDSKHILDPLDYPVKEKKNPYPIVSYRLFNKQKNMKEHKVKELKKAAEKYFGLKLGKRISSSEDRKIAEGIKEMYKEVVDLTHIHATIDEETDNCQRELEKEKEKNKRFSQTISGYYKRVKELENQIEVQKETIEDLENVNNQVAKDTKILDALAFALKAILNR